MILGKVVGTVVATQKDRGLEGFKLQVIQTLDIQTLRPGSRFLVAVDAVGAGTNEVVPVYKWKFRAVDRLDRRPSGRRGRRRHRRFCRDGGRNDLPKTPMNEH